MTTLGMLDAHNLGSVVSVIDGGSTHTGTLKSINHQTGWRSNPLTVVTLYADDWRHIKSYPSETPCQIVEVPE